MKSIYKLLLTCSLLLMYLASYGQTHTIPVVVHNMNDGVQGQMTKAEVLDLIEGLNTYYSNYTPRFKFKIAMIDPDGNCGLAITGIGDPTTNIYGSALNSTIDGELKQTTRWPSNKYLNIWTVVSIDDIGDGNGSSFEGYAHTPCYVMNEDDPLTGVVLPLPCYDFSLQNSPHSVLDGVVIKHDAPIGVLAHEVAHWLNVFHTNGPDEFLTSSKWIGCHGNTENFTQGDFCDDTPPVDYTLINTTQNTCTLDDPDTPDDLTNLMRYGGTDGTLTSCQLTRMSDCLQTTRTNISSLSNLTETGVSPISVVLDNPVITTSAAWSTSNTPNTVDIIGDLTVENNVVFQIQNGMTLRFCDEGRLIVKQGATLKLRGTLTTIASGSKWDGISLWGDPAGFSGLGGNTATFFGENNAKIENATVGIRSYGPSTFQAGSGIVIENMSFNNCDISIDVAPTGSWSFVVVKASDFQNDHNPDFEAFIKLRRHVGTAMFRGCDFTSNSTSSCIEEHGIGIFVDNSTFAVDATCTFNRLGYGIKVSTPTGEKPFSVWNSEFNGCYRGIYSTSGNFTIWKNVFDNTGISTSVIHTCTGLSEPITHQISIHLEDRIFGADIQDNEFNHNSPLTAINICADNLGPINNKIRRNIFHSANGIWGMNINSTTISTNPTLNLHLKRGLYFQCNEFFSSNRAVWSKSLGSLSVRQIQLNVDESMNLFSAGNKWIGTGDHIVNDNLLGDSIAYYYSTAGFEKPTIPSTVTNIETVLSTTINCPSEIATTFGMDPNSPVDPNTPIGPVGPNGPNVGIQPSDIPSHLPGMIARQDSIEDLLTALSNGTGGIGGTVGLDPEVIGAALWETNDELLANIIATYQMYPSVWNENSYEYYLMKLNSVVGDYTLFNYYVGQENWTKASSILYNIPSKYYLNSQQTIEYNGLVTLYNIINSTALPNLSNAQINNLVAIAEGDKGTARSWSRSILTLHGYQYTSTVDLPTGKGRSIEAKLSSGIKVYPNPASSMLYFETEQDLVLESVVIESISGKEILRSSIADINAIDISALNSGIYIVKCISNNNIVSIDKFIKQ